MPPEIPNPPTPPHHAPLAISPDLTAVASFFNLSGYGASLSANAFTRKEHTDRLINIARTAEKEGDQLKALAMIQKTGLELLDITGQLATQRKTHVNQDGSTTSLEARTLSRLLTNLPSAETLNLAGVTVREPTETPAPLPAVNREAPPDDPVES
jgi:hypothetical protein